MTRRARRCITLAISAAATAVLVWLPTAAQAGVVFNGID
jgi:hypothetical protein